MLAHFLCSSSAVRTDFILSAEIIVISLGTVAKEAFAVQVGVLITIAVLMTVGVYGLVAGIVGVPLGVIAHNYVVPLMGSTIGTNIPSADIDVYNLPELISLALAGLAIALLGAALPAGWAAKSRTQNALHAE